MSQLLDRLRFFNAKKQDFSDGHGVKTEEDRGWKTATAAVGSMTRLFAPRMV